MLSRNHFEHISSDERFITNFLALYFKSGDNEMAFIIRTFRPNWNASKKCVFCLWWICFVIFCSFLFDLVLSSNRGDLICCKKLNHSVFMENLKCPHCEYEHYERTKKTYLFRLLAKKPKLLWTCSENMLCKRTIFKRFYCFCLPYHSPITIKQTHWDSRKKNEFIDTRMAWQNFLNLFMSYRFFFLFIRRMTVLLFFFVCDDLCAKQNGSIFSWKITIFFKWSTLLGCFFMSREYSLLVGGTFQLNKNFHYKFAKSHGKWAMQV